MRLLILVVTVLAVLSPSLAYYMYQTRIPNGQLIPHPCKPNFLWHGVGHINPLGGGPRNQFGEDFARHGLAWGAELCRMDSDKDGLTNGQELGDPNCRWQEGDVPQYTENITHPGVCDPWNSQSCGTINTWVTCDTGEFRCDAINDPDVRNLTLRFPVTKVPAAETTYRCFVFDLPSDQPYHLIATQPYIDNPNVMHHILVYGCQENAPLVSEPTECFMELSACSQIIGAWLLGLPGVCTHSDAGFRIGAHGYKRIGMQIHWTNKHLADNWYDSSGLTLYYTPRLRQYDAGSLIVGQDFLEIPPGQPSVTVSGVCSSECTQKTMSAPIKVINALNHMHYLGISEKVEVFRGGQKLAELTNDQPYSYDNPQFYTYSTPIELLPGDEFKTTCEFSSLGKSRTTISGPSSFDEMCYAMIVYYPAQNLNDSGCIAFKDQNGCHFQETRCDFNILNSSHPETQKLFERVQASCNSYGTCWTECPAAIEEARAENGCLDDWAWEYIKYYIYQYGSTDPKLYKFIASVDSCAHRSPGTQPSMTTPAPGVSGSSSSTGEKSNILGVFLQLLLLQNIIINADGN